MAPHSSILAWKIPWGGAWWAAVHGSLRVRHNLATNPPPPPHQPTDNIYSKHSSKMRTTLILVIILINI